jgi:hypothetical protein
LLRTTSETGRLLPRLHTLELVSGTFTDDNLSSMTAARVAHNHSIITKVHSIDSMRSLVDDLLAPK